MYTDSEDPSKLRYTKQLTSTIKIDVKETVTCVFLDFEGAFQNTCHYAKRTVKTQVEVNKYHTSIV